MQEILFGKILLTDAVDSQIATIIALQGNTVRLNVLVGPKSNNNQVLEGRSGQRNGLNFQQENSKHGVVDQVLDSVSPKVLSTIASVIALAPRAIDERLLRQPDPHSCRQKDAAFDGPSRPKGPTRTANSLVFHLERNENRNKRLLNRMIVSV